MARTHTYKPISRNRHTQSTHEQIYTNEIEKYRQPLYQTWCNVDRSNTYWQTEGCPRFLTSSLLIHSLSTSRTYYACEYTRVYTHTHTRDGQHVRHVCAENWIRRGSRGPASVISQSCQGLTLYNVIYKELTMDDRRGDWKLWLYAPRTFLPSLGFFPCNVFLLLIFFCFLFITYTWNSHYSFVAKVVEKYWSKV